MNRFRFISFLLFFLLGTIITVFNSCSEDETLIDKNDQPGTDPDMPDSYTVGGISLLVGDNMLSLAVDSSYTFKTTVWPEYATDQAVTWTSSNPDKVEVTDEGKITALAVGTALITAKVGDKTDTCRVTATRAATSVTLNYAALSLAIGGEEGVLEVIVEPADATDIIEWTCTTQRQEERKEKSKLFAVKEEGKTAKVTAIDAGTAYVKVKVGNFMRVCTVKALYETTLDRGVVIDSIKWATRNVDKPGEFAAPGKKGMLYQWDHNIGWSTTGPMTSSDGSLWSNIYSTDSIWTTSNDVCPDGWRIPTVEEWDRLLKSGNNKSKWETGISGRTFGSDNNAIFLPAAGYRDGDGGILHKEDGISGYYWSSKGSHGDNMAFGLFFDNRNVNKISERKKNGFSIRCVEDK
jgi:uncharacterized protein (TIGR02145 family)